MFETQKKSSLFSTCCRVATVIPEKSESHNGDAYDTSTEPVSISPL